MMEGLVTRILKATVCSVSDVTIFCHFHLHLIWHTPYYIVSNCRIELRVWLFQSWPRSYSRFSYVHFLSCLHGHSLLEVVIAIFNKSRKNNKCKEILAGAGSSLMLPFKKILGRIKLNFHCKNIYINSLYLHVQIYIHTHNHAQTTTHRRLK